MAEGWSDVPTQARDHNPNLLKKGTMKRRAPILLAGVLLLTLVTSTSAQQHWRVRGGTTQVSFHETRLAGLGMELIDVRETGEQVSPMEGAYAFEITEESKLECTVENGIFVEWRGGEIAHEGGFSFAVDGIPRGIEAFTIVPRDRGGPSDLFVGEAGRDSAVAFELDMPMIQFDRSRALLTVGCMDLRISRDLALELGRPELEGQLIGMMSTMASVIWSGGNPDDDDWRSPLGEGVVDLAISNFELLTMLGRQGNFPNGVNGLSMSTTICNVGTADADWLAPMDTRHPMIVMSVYRVHEGRFEQIGVSGVKHGFFATNQACASCDHPGTSQRLGPGCSDTYSVSNNGDRTWLAPRSEVQAFKGTWECLGSYFADGRPDCIRRNFGDGLDPVQNRIVVRDEDLAAASEAYFYEAYYIAYQDDLRDNNITYRAMTPTWNSGTQQWRFNDQSSIRQGPAIFAWGQRQQIAEPRVAGDIILAVQTTDLGAGQHRYDYALYNFDQSPGTESLSIPVESGITVSSSGFRDVDDNPSNDWEVRREVGRLRWVSKPKPNQNPLGYATCFNFWFEADASPKETRASIGLHQSTKPSKLHADTFGPSALKPGKLR